MLPTTIACIHLDELIQELVGSLASHGRVVQPEHVGEWLLAVAKVALNKSHTTFDDLDGLQEQIAKLYPTMAGITHEFTDDMYLAIVHELPKAFSGRKDIFAVDKVANYLEVRLLVSEEALTYCAINTSELVALVI